MGFEDELNVFDRAWLSRVSVLDFLIMISLIFQPFQLLTTSDKVSAKFVKSFTRSDALIFFAIQVLNILDSAKNL